MSEGVKCCSHLEAILADAIAHDDFVNADGLVISPRLGKELWETIKPQGEQCQPAYLGLSIRINPRVPDDKIVFLRDGVPFAIIDLSNADG